MIQALTPTGITTSLDLAAMANAFEDAMLSEDEAFDVCQILGHTFQQDAPLDYRCSRCNREGMVCLHTHRDGSGCTTVLPVPNDYLDNQFAGPKRDPDYCEDHQPYIMTRDDWDEYNAKDFAEDD